MLSNQAKYINLDTVKQLTTLSKSCIYALMRNGRFPANGKLKDSTRVVWVRQEIEVYLDEQFERNTNTTTQ